MSSMDTHLIDGICALHYELQPEWIYSQGEEADETAHNGDGDTLNRKFNDNQIYKHFINCSIDWHLVGYSHEVGEHTDCHRDEAAAHLAYRDHAPGLAEDFSI